MFFDKVSWEQGLGITFSGIYFTSSVKRSHNTEEYGCNFVGFYDFFLNGSIIADIQYYVSFICTTLWSNI